MKVSKLDKQQKIFDLYKLLGTMSRIDCVGGDIILDDELKAKVFAAIEPVLKRRASKGELLPVFEGNEAIQMDAFPEVEDTYSNAVDDHAKLMAETDAVISAVEQSTAKRKRGNYVDGFEKP